MATDPRTFVIVGAGQAGRWLVLTLRASGFDGRIIWFGDEAERAYERPPLSKAVLKGEASLEQLALLPEAKFAELNLDWRPATAIVAIDRAARALRTAAGAVERYDTLFLAHGGRARMLPGLADHPRVLSLRTWSDALALNARIEAAERVLVLGGGWIGLEVAASARRMGKAVTVLEAAPRLVARTMPPVVSAHLAALHAEQGTEVLLGAAVTAVQPDAGGVGVTLGDGRHLRGDVLVVGIGLVPNEALARDAGLACGNGVHTDAFGRTDDPHIFAVGDVANAVRADGTRLRLESWENAQRQAVAAAKASLDQPHDPDAEGPCWFWSDQYDDNLQVLGLPDESLQLIERRDEGKRQRLLFFVAGREIKALAAVNGGREVKLVRRWMTQRRFPDPAALADGATDLNKLPLTPLP